MTAHPALVLNADFRPLSYFPLSLLSWQDAIRLIFQEKIVVVAEYDKEIRSPSTTMRLPSVVAVKAFVKMPRYVAFTRFNVFLRDGFRCQYCGNQFDSRDLTFDHFIPRARGGETRWENVVTACEPCNTLKGHRDDMKPLRKPKRPTPHELFAAKRIYPSGFLHESWLDFLYWDAELETSP